MSSLTSSVLSRARSAYRALPVGFRMRVGRGLRMVVEPVMARSLEAATAGPFPKAASVEVMGVFSAPLGHAQAAKLCASELERAGLNVSCADTSQALGIGGAAIADAADAKPAPSNSDAVVFVLNPDSLVHALVHLDPAMTRGKRRVGYWVWELETAPARWKGLADHLVNDIWAPSQFAATAIARVFDRPVQVVPHPAALAPPIERTPERRQAVRARLGVGRDTFIALTSFAFTSSMARKNPMAAIAAFGKAFDAPRDDALLVVRCLNGALFPAARNRLHALVREAGRQVLLLEDGGLEELHDLYAAADCYLSLHRSEGFGLNLAEAMLAGMPVVATGWSGNLDFMDETSAALVPVRALIPVADPQNVYSMRGAVWADPDTNAAIAHLRRLAKDSNARTLLAATGRAAALARLGGGAAGRVLLG